MKKINNIDNPILWDENFIQNFKIENPSKKIGIIKWNQDENRMRLQLLSCIRNKVDVILSEVVPGDFEDNLLNSEFEYFCEHYLYIPPKVQKVIKKYLRIIPY